MRFFCVIRPSVYEAAGPSDNTQRELATMIDKVVRNSTKERTLVLTPEIFGAVQCGEFIRNSLSAMCVEAWNAALPSLNHGAIAGEVDKDEEEKIIEELVDNAWSDIEAKGRFYITVIVVCFGQGAPLTEFLLGRFLQEKRNLANRKRVEVRSNSAYLAKVAGDDILTSYRGL